MTLKLLLLTSIVSANVIDDYLDSIINVEAFVNDPTTATWRNHLYIQVIQAFLVLVSLTDFTVYTLNFLYGLALAIPNMPAFEKLMPIAIGSLFLFVRFLYLPFLVILMPFNGFPLFPTMVYKVTFFGLAVLYICLLLLPLIFGTQWAIKWRNSDRGNEKVIKRAKQRVKKRLAKHRIPQIIVVMPIYNEDPDALTVAVDSIVNGVYPSRSMAAYISFDSDETSDLFLHLMKFLTNGSEPPLGGYPLRTHIIYKKVHFIINRFPHGGKRNTQALTFAEIAKTYKGKERGTFCLFIDSDILLYEDCIIEFVRAMEKNKALVGMTGFISAISSRERNFFWYLQDCEYVVGQIFARSLEAALGGVTCLPGALTIVRLKELCKAAETYFAELPTEKIFDFHRYHLGEDRYLTHLLMEQSKSYSIGFCPSARAKTEAPGTWTAFLKQRRRWLLGAFSNEVYFLSDYRLWKRVPLLILYKICDFASRSASFFLYIVLFQIITGVHYSTVQSIIIWFPLLANWLLLLIFAILLKRLKVMMFLNPWMYFFINLYAIWTWNLRSWGGPRASTDEESQEMSDVGVDSDHLASPTIYVSAELLAMRKQASEVSTPFSGSTEFYYDSSGSTASLDSNDSDSSIWSDDSDVGGLKAPKRVMHRDSASASTSSFGSVERPSRTPIRSNSTSSLNVVTMVNPSPVGSPVPNSNLSNLVGNVARHGSSQSVSGRRFVTSLTPALPPK